MTLLAPRFRTEEPEESSLTKRIKFYRRSDLTSWTRLQIALAAKEGNYGKITQLSGYYKVSRKFIYELKAQLDGHLERFWSPKKSRIEFPPLSLVAYILQLRLIGRNSLHAIRQLIPNVFGDTAPNSIGYISQKLKEVGESLPNQIQCTGACVYASDELFLRKDCPILVTVDVYSGAILRLDLKTELKKEHWEDHWQQTRQKITPLKLISDGGIALKSARLNVLNEIPFQPDTFHVVSHRLGVFCERLLNQAWSAIETEYGRAVRFDTTQQEATALKKASEWELAIRKSKQAIEKYELFQFLYGCMVEQFIIFDKQGLNRTRIHAEQEVQTALDFLRQLEIPNLKTEIDYIEKQLGELFAFLDTAAQGVALVAAQVEPFSLRYWTLAWQYEKKAYKVKNNYPLQQYFFKKRDECLAFVKQFKPSPEDFFRSQKQNIFKILEVYCAQASSAVENANAFIRLFVNQARDQMEQHSLNLILFYYNHHCFERGKRKGFAPIELLTGQKLTQNWLELLLDHLKQ